VEIALKKYKEGELRLPREGSSRDALQIRPGLVIIKFLLKRKLLILRR